jgi:hypothetical protein
MRLADLRRQGGRIGQARLASGHARQFRVVSGPSRAM